MRDEPLLNELRLKADKLRCLAIEAIYQAQSGHPGASLSLADIIAVLYFHELSVDPHFPANPDRDRVVLSKGHAAPIWYAALAEAGFFPKEELFRLRKIDSLLQGHPCNTVPGVDLTTGSLGLGLSGAVGMAIGGKRRKSPARVYAILGDGEQGEGQIWEAAMAAAHFKLDNLMAITDRNLYQNDGPTSEVMGLEPLAEKWRAFGWYIIEADGHNIAALLAAFALARETRGRPTMLLAHTIKGKGAAYLINRPELHYTPPTREQRDAVLAQLGGLK